MNYIYDIRNKGGGACQILNPQNVCAEENKQTQNNHSTCTPGGRFCYDFLKLCLSANIVCVLMFTIIPGKMCCSRDVGAVCLILIVYGLCRITR